MKCVVRQGSFLFFTIHSVYDVGKSKLFILFYFLLSYNMLLVLQQHKSCYYRRKKSNLCYKVKKRE